MRYFSIICLVCLSCQAFCQDTLPGARDPWLWPFAANSIWNMPIGSQAVYMDANLEAANHVGVDIQHILVLDNADPVREVLGTEVWGAGRCDGLTPLGFQLRVPDNWIVPDAGNSPYGLTPNGNFAMKLPDVDTVFEGSQISRCTPAGPVHLPTWMRFPNNRTPQSIKGNGLGGRGQGASGMSALGGTIRLGELTASDPIRHAIKINPWAAKYCFYSDSIPGFKWPARAADNYAANVYGGSDPHLLMGSLLAIPPEITLDSLNLQTEPGKKLFFTLQNYGMYFTEDAAWDTWDIIVERDAELEFEQAFGFSMESQIWKDELNQLMQALSIVVNNGPNLIGGGGTPLQPLAPPFSSLPTRVEVGNTPHILSAFPNPLIGDVLYFSDTVRGEVFTVEGKRVTSFAHKKQIQFVYPAGMYFIHLINGQNRSTQIVIKE